MWRTQYSECSRDGPYILRSKTITTFINTTRNIVTFNRSLCRHFFYIQIVEKSLTTAYNLYLYNTT